MGIRLLRPLGSSVAVLALLGVSAPASPLAAQAGSLRLEVRDPSGGAIPFASAVLPGGRVVGGDRLGRIPISGETPGAHRITVRAIGFSPIAIDHDFSSKSATRVVTLSRVAISLPDLTVRAADSDPIAAYYDRARRYGGRLVPRYIIARNGLMRTSEVLIGVSRVRYQNRPMSLGGPIIDFPGCRGAASRISVWVDGRELAGSPAQSGELGALLDRVAPSEIEAIEIYRSRDEIPPQYRNDSCAGMLIWTERFTRGS